MFYHLGCWGHKPLQSWKLLEKLVYFSCDRSGRDWPGAQLCRSANCSPQAKFGQPPASATEERSEHGILICLLLLSRFCKVKNIYYLVLYRKGFPGGSAIKNPPAMQQTQVQSLGWEDALHSSILAWRIPLTEETSGLQSTGSQRVRHDCEHAHTSL